jgi:hypothetical protein
VFVPVAQCAICRRLSAEQGHPAFDRPVVTTHLYRYARLLSTLCDELSKLGLCADPISGNGRQRSSVDEGLGVGV